MPPRPLELNPFLSRLSESGPIRITPVATTLPVGDILGECNVDPNINEIVLRERLQTKMARQRAKNFCCIPESTTKTIIEGSMPPRSSETIPVIADTLQLLDSNPIFADPLKLTNNNTTSTAFAATTSSVLAKRHKVVLPAWPNDLVERVRAAVDFQCERPTTPEFRFELSTEAASHNASILIKHNFDLGAAIDNNSSSPLGYGSEFRPVHVIRQLYKHHPNWIRLQSILTNGSEWKLDELDNDTRRNDLIDALTFGNHKGASQHPELLRQLVEKDVTQGFGLVIPLSFIERIPGALLAPMNIMEQTSITERGQIIPKK